VIHGIHCLRHCGIRPRRSSGWTTGRRAIPDVLVVHGMDTLSAKMPDAAVELEKCFEIRRTHEPPFVVEYV
jgi:hypothetical protein